MAVNLYIPPESDIHPVPGVEIGIADMIRLRGTYSRDVRAANLSERFDKTGGSATITDPRYPADGAITVTRFSGGNPAVRPEEADTFTLGAVFQPAFIPGLSLSEKLHRVFGLLTRVSAGLTGSQSPLTNFRAAAYV